MQDHNCVFAPGKGATTGQHTQPPADFDVLTILRAVGAGERWASVRKVLVLQA